MKKPFMIILIVCSAVFVVAAIINENPDKIPKAKNAVKPIQKRAAPPKPWSPTPAKSTESMTFPKHLISLEEVKKHPELHTEQEQLAYWYRYNQSAAGYHHRKPEMAKKNYQRFLSYKSALGETRFYEIMNLADKDYPFTPSRP